jgi:hypothetical protein
VPTLDRSESIELEDAREFPKYSPTDAYEGDVIGASGESPTKTKEAKMMEGIGFSGGQFVAFPIDGRVFLTIPAPDYSTTQVFEVTAHDGATKLFDVEGWASKMFKVR